MTDDILDQMMSVEEAEAEAQKRKKNVAERMLSRLGIGVNKVTADVAGLASELGGTNAAKMREKVLSANDQARRDLGPSSGLLEDIAGSVTESLPALITSLGPGRVLGRFGPRAGAAGMGLTYTALGTPDVLERGRELGNSSGQQAADVIAEGAIQTALPMMLPGGAEALARMRMPEKTAGVRELLKRIGRGAAHGAVDEGKEELIQGILSRARENVITQDPEALPAIPDASEKGAQAAGQMLIETLAGAAMGGPMQASGHAAGVPGALVRAVKNRMAKVDAGVTPPSTEQAIGGPMEQPEDPQEGLKRLDEKIQTLLGENQAQAQEQQKAGEKQAKDIVKRFQKSVKDWEKKYGPRAEAPVLGTQGAVGGNDAQAGAGATAAQEPAAAVDPGAGGGGGVGAGGDPAISGRRELVSFIEGELAKGAKPWQVVPSVRERFGLKATEAMDAISDVVAAAGPKQMGTGSEEKTDELLAASGVKVVPKVPEESSAVVVDPLTKTPERNELGNELPKTEQVIGGPRDTGTPGENVGGDIREAIKNYRLPADMAKAAPRYRDRTLVFHSDFDKAAYIVENTKTKSKGEERILESVRKIGVSPGQMREYGNDVKRRIAQHAAQGGSGDLIVTHWNGNAYSENPIETPKTEQALGGPGDVQNAEASNPTVSTGAEPEKPVLNKPVPGEAVEDWKAKALELAKQKLAQAQAERAGVRDAKAEALARAKEKLLKGISEMKKAGTMRSLAGPELEHFMGALLDLADAGIKTFQEAMATIKEMVAEHQADKAFQDAMGYAWDAAVKHAPKELGLEPRPVEEVKNETPSTPAVEPTTHGMPDTASPEPAPDVEVEPDTNADVKPSVKSKTMELSEKLLSELDQDTYKISWQQMLKIAENVYGGSIGKGDFTMQDVYEALQAAINKKASEMTPGQVQGKDPSEAIRILEDLANRAPAQTVRARLDDGRAILGRTVHDDEIFGVLSKFEAQHTLDNSQMWGKLQSGSTLTLQNGWKIVPKRVGNEIRMELSGKINNEELAAWRGRLQAMDVITEYRNFNWRYFVPSAEVLERLMKTSEVKYVITKDDSESDSVNSPERDLAQNQRTVQTSGRQILNPAAKVTAEDTADGQDTYHGPERDLTKKQESLPESVEGPIKNGNAADIRRVQGLLAQENVGGVELVFSGDDSVSFDALTGRVEVDPRFVGEKGVVAILKNAKGSTVDLQGKTVQVMSESGQMTTADAGVVVRYLSEQRRKARLLVGCLG